MRHTKGWTVLATLVASALAVAACSDADMGGSDWPRGADTLFIRMAVPQGPMTTRAETGLVAGSDAETRVGTIDLWVYDHGDGSLLAHESFVNTAANKQLAGGEKVFAIAIDRSVADGLSAIDVLAVANKEATDVVLTDSATKVQLLSATFSNYGVADDTRTVPECGLPMSAVREGMAVRRVGSLLSADGRLTMERAVSKMRVIVARTKQMSEACITGIDLMTSQIPVYEYLFNDTPYGHRHADSYEDAQLSFGALANSEIGEHPDPLDMAYSGRLGAQEYENLVGLSLSNGWATQLGPVYLLESCLQLTGTIRYRLTADDTERTAQFAMRTAGDFGRGHTWTVYACFADGQMDVSSVVAPWDTWRETIDYQQVVAVSETLNWQQETILGEQRVYTTETVAQPADSTGAGHETTRYLHTIVTMRQPTPADPTAGDAVCHFCFDAPAFGTWRAEFIGASDHWHEGDYVFVDDAGIETHFTSGMVGRRATLRIRPKVIGPTESRRAYIRLTVSDHVGRVYTVESSVIGALPLMSQPFI